MTTTTRTTTTMRRKGRDTERQKDAKRKAAAAINSVHTIRAPFLVTNRPLFLRNEGQKHVQTNRAGCSRLRKKDPACALPWLPRPRCPALAHRRRWRCRRRSDGRAGRRWRWGPASARASPSRRRPPAASPAAAAAAAAGGAAASPPSLTSAVPAPSEVSAAGAASAAVAAAATAAAAPSVTL